METKRKKILFVDDEPNVLHGLKRMLHGMRREWEMQFAESAEDALSKMETDPFDVVVTDMRMPRMTGDELLCRVREQHPETVRIILSGQSDTKLIMGSVQVAHQYVSKPASPDELKIKINRACALLELLRKPSLRKIVSSMESLPTLPQLFHEITEELKKEDASMRKVGDLISRDPAMTAKILQIVNSSFFSLPRTIKSPAEAVTLLGLDTVKSLVLTVEIFSKFDRDTLKLFDIEGLWEHSVHTGTLARAIAAGDDMEKQTIDNACMAGLLHDIGKLVFMENFTGEYQKTIQLSKSETISIQDAENRIFGASHCQVGAYLLGLWGLPGDIVETVGFHHDPGQLPGRQSGILTAVYIANAFARCGEVHMETSDLLDSLDTAYMKETGIMDRINAYDEIRRDMLEKKKEDDE